MLAKLMFEPYDSTLGNELKRMSWGREGLCQACLGEPTVMNRRINEGDRTVPPRNPAFLTSIGVFSEVSNFVWPLQLWLSFIGIRGLCPRFDAGNFCPANSIERGRAALARARQG